MQHRFFAYALILTLVGSLFSVVLPAVPSHASHENITINIGDDVTNVYSPEDTVVIEGTIEDVQEDEDVTVTILNPDGDPEDDDDVIPDEDDGYFAFEFEIPDDADGGIWTVQAEYDDEEVFSYFMVEFNEDDIDVIEVDLDETDGIYGPEDTVEIDGTVPDPDNDKEFVRIIVLDPANGEIEDDEVELDDNEFTFEFDLGEDHGRYAIIVTYDGPGDQRGMVIAEIPDEEEDEDDDDNGGDTITEGSDGDLSAEIDDDTYEQGTTVTITGEINNYDSGEDLIIRINDPDEDEIFVEDDVDVDEDGDDGTFEFEYDIDDDADEGLYIILIEYDNDEVELAFEVEESSGGDEDDDAVTKGITDGDLTAKLNKASYLAGETITVSGEVDELKEEDDNPERVFVLLYRPNGAVILAASENVEPSSNGAFSANVVLDIDYDLEEDDDYWITATYAEDEVRLPFDITGVSSTPSNEITVETDKSEYQVGQTVEISGKVPTTLIETGQQLLLRVDKPDGNPCRIDPVNVPSSGSFTYDLVLGGICAVAGEYDVEVTYGDEEASTSFEVMAAGGSSTSYPLTVGERTYPIEYELPNGAITSMNIPKDQDGNPIPRMLIRVNAEQDGQLTVVLPRAVLDAIENGEDIDFIVTAEDEQGNISTVDFESENTNSERTLVIDYEAGTSRIEIQGTQVVPEFGAIAAIILAVAIVGIIVATTKYGNKFSLFRQ